MSNAKRHRWKQQKCVACGMQWRRNVRPSKNPNDFIGRQAHVTEFLVDGVWIEMQNTPPCVKAPTCCPTCKGTGVVAGEPTAPTEATEAKEEG